MFCEPLQYDLIPDLHSENPCAEIYETDARSEWIRRRVHLRNGEWLTSSVNRRAIASSTDAEADFDAAWLGTPKRPGYNVQLGTLRLADLFCGCGGLSLGIEEAGRALGLLVDHVFAADTNPIALATYKRNFSPEKASGDPLETVVGKVDSQLSGSERELQVSLGEIDVLAGGPPCQGNSDLNNHTRRKDPKNALLQTMVRFAQVLTPKHVIIENVPGVRHDEEKVTESSVRALTSMGYAVSHGVLTASHFGVPQRRRRYLIVATMESKFCFPRARAKTHERTVRWACQDLLNVQTGSAVDSHASTSKANRERIAYLFDNDLYDLPDDLRPECHRLKKHSYKAVYGRLRWDEPAPTITSGFNSPGQGRFVHPDARRTLTPHEAARIQFLPDFFNWGTTTREGLTHMIGNAVPPKLAYTVALELLR